MREIPTAIWTQESRTTKIKHPRLIPKEIDLKTREYSKIHIEIRGAVNSTQVSLALLMITKHLKGKNQLEVDKKQIKPIDYLCLVKNLQFPLELIKVACLVEIKMILNKEICSGLLKQ